MKTAEILIVGDEILMGEIEDENGPWLIDQLSSRGITVNRLSVIPDNPEVIATEIEMAQDRETDYLLITGGIGPTHDDLTRKGVARGLDVEQTPHKRVLDWLETYYGERVNDARLRMANLPEESEPILLEETPAIAFRTEFIYVFPGIPSLMKPLFAQWSDQFVSVEHHVKTLTIRAWEGDIAEALESVQASSEHEQIGCYPHPDGTLTLKVRGTDQGSVNETYRKLEETFEGEME